MTGMMTRRNLLHLAVGTACCVALPIPAFAVDKNFDVVVVGSGAAGFIAAIRSAENGAKTALLEANSWVGGASRVATGIFGCAGHPIQKALGIKTTPEDLYQLYIGEAAATKTKGDPEAARLLADGAIPAADWLASIGVEWRTDKAQKFFLNSKAGHRLGELLIAALEKKARSLGVEIFTQTRGTELLLKDGKVCGIACDTLNGQAAYGAKAVVLATGGFEGNPEMIRKYIGKGWENVGVYCTPLNRGDGQRMAEKAGAKLEDMEVFKANPTVHVSNGNKYNLISAVREGAFAVNQNGERFMNETGGYYQSHKMREQPGEKVWLIFGDPVVKADPRLEKMIQAGSIASAASVKELAQEIGVPAENLQTTIGRLEEQVKAGKDSDFKRGSLKNPLGGKIYAAPIAPFIQGTFGGVKTNTRTEALNDQGNVIPGLYAVGECAAVGLRGLNPQTANVVFGSIAGKNAAQYARK